MYTARQLDEESGLYYYRNRYYGPEIGRFITPDPIGYLAGLNLYAYVGNNPVNWRDPWGLIGIPVDTIHEVEQNMQESYEESERTREQYEEHKGIDEPRKKFQDPEKAKETEMKRTDYINKVNEIEKMKDVNKKSKK